jgi:hypothetical protein
VSEPVHLLRNSAWNYLSFLWCISNFFESIDGFELWQRGLSFLGLLVGMIFAMLSDSYWQWKYRRLERSHEALKNQDFKFLPEWRLPPGICLLALMKSKLLIILVSEAIVGAPLVTVGLFIFAWTTYPNIHWIVPMIGSALFGVGYVLKFMLGTNAQRKISMNSIHLPAFSSSCINSDKPFPSTKAIIVFSGIFTYLVDAYPAYSASALAANSFTWSTFAGIFPLFGTQSK